MIIFFANWLQLQNMDNKTSFIISNNNSNNSTRCLCGSYDFPLQIKVSLAIIVALRISTKDDLPSFGVFLKKKLQKVTSVAPDDVAINLVNGYIDPSISVRIPLINYLSSSLLLLLETSIVFQQCSHTGSSTPLNLTEIIMMQSNFGTS